MKNTKETVKIGILLILIVGFAIFFGTTKGNDELNLNLNFNFNTVDESFSYPVYASEYNGLYRNSKSNGIYAFVGKNVDDTYRVYFIKTSPRKEPMLKLDSTTMQDKVITFNDNSNPSIGEVKFNIKFSANEMTVSPASLGLSNEKIEGHYLKTKNIEQFTMSEFEY